VNPTRRATLAVLPSLIWPVTALPAPLPPGLTLVTGDLPPMTMPGEPGQRGVLLDLVEAMLKLAELPAQPEFFPWARALLLAGEKPRTLIVPLNRTPEREARFQWLVKLYAQRFVFLTLAGKPRVETIEQARRLRIAGLRGSSNLDQLQLQGVPPGRVYQATSVGDIQRALEHGLVDAIYGSELIHIDAWRRSGRNPALLQTGLTLQSADVWLAAQGGITEPEQTRLQQAHDGLLADGSVERLFKRYGLKFRAEDLR
jgi:polar amino acid transport system substrate-binding protein